MKPIEYHIELLDTVPCINISEFLCIIYLDTLDKPCLPLSKHSCSYPDSRPSPGCFCF